MSQSPQRGLLSLSYNGNLMRVRQDEQGSLWFVGKDVCAVLGLSNHCDAVASLAEYEKGVAITDTRDGQQAMLTVSESGLYSLIFRSSKQEAHAFCRWITAEVLRALRGQPPFSPAQDRDGIGNRVSLLICCEDAVMRSRGMLRRSLRLLMFDAQKLLPCFPRHPQAKKYLMECLSFARNSCHALDSSGEVDLLFPFLPGFSRDVLTGTRALLDSGKVLTTDRWCGKLHSLPKLFALEYMLGLVWTTHENANAVCSSMEAHAEAEKRYEETQQRGEVAE